MNSLGVGVGLLLALGNTISKDAIVVDRVVGVVEEEVITESELLMEARVNLLLRHGERLAKLELPEGYLVSQLNSLINSLVVMIHIRRFGAGQIPEQQVRDAMAKIRAGKTETTYTDFLDKFGIKESDIESVLRREIGNDEYLRSRLKMGQEGIKREFDREDMGEVVKWIKQMKASLTVRAVTCSAGNPNTIFGRKLEICN